MGNVWGKAVYVRLYYCHDHPDPQMLYSSILQALLEISRCSKVPIFLGGSFDKPSSPKVASAFQELPVIQGLPQQLGPKMKNQVKRDPADWQNTNHWLCVLFKIHPPFNFGEDATWSSLQWNRTSLYVEILRSFKIDNPLDLVLDVVQKVGWHSNLNMQGFIQMNNFVLWQVTRVIRHEGGVVHDSGWNQDQDKCRLLNLCHFEAGLFDLFPDHRPHWYVCTLNLEACSLHWVLESLERSLESMAVGAVERCALKVAFHTPCISHSDCLFKLSSYGVILWLRLKQWKILSGGKRQLIHCYSWTHLEAAHFGSAILYSRLWPWREQLGHILNIQWQSYVPRQQIL